MSMVAKSALYRVADIDTYNGLMSAMLEKDFHLMFSPLFSSQVHPIDHPNSRRPYLSQ